MVALRSQSLRAAEAVGHVQRTAKRVRRIDDPRLVKAMSHPLRVRILAMLDERKASPNQLAGWLGASLGTVAYAIAFALIALLVAHWLGDDAGWNALQEKGLQEEYLLALGGPYAAAVLAKYSAVAASQNEGKPAEVPGNADLGQLFANDSGDADLGDFQYVLLTTIALTWVIATFLGHLHEGLPDIPPVLAGLALTSTGAYSVKKLLAGTPPTLTHAHPPEALSGADVQVWGKNLVVPSTAADDPAQLPSVLIGNKPATATAMGSSPGGVDRLTVTVPEELAPSTYLLTAMRADGIAATGPGATNGLPFRVLEPPNQPNGAAGGGT